MTKKEFIEKYGDLKSKSYEQMFNLEVDADIHLQNDSCSCCKFVEICGLRSNVEQGKIIDDCELWERDTE